MNLKSRLIAIVVGCHFGLIACGAMHVNLAYFGGPGRLMATISAYTGAETGFGFFAPSVASEVRTRFEITGSDGGRRVVNLVASGNREADLRTGSSVETFVTIGSNSRIRHLISASWAASIFGRHPDAEKVRVLVEIHDLPTMAAYHAGERPRWRLLYESTFTKKAGGPASQAVAMGDQPR